MATIVFLKDVLTKKEELQRYKNELETFKLKLDYIQKHIDLTKRIIQMIEKEQIVEIQSAQ